MSLCLNLVEGVIALLTRINSIIKWEIALETKVIHTVLETIINCMTKLVMKLLLRTHIVAIHHLIFNVMVNFGKSQWIITRGPNIYIISWVEIRLPRAILCYKPITRVRQLEIIIFICRIPVKLSIIALNWKLTIVNIVIRVVASASVLGMRI